MIVQAGTTRAGTVVDVTFLGSEDPTIIFYLEVKVRIRTDINISMI